MGLHPGALVGSNVRLLRPLSRGGMGSVWRAEHLTLHTEVAVKFVADALIGDAGFLTRFTREAVASARIKSPHAVQIFDHGVTADGQPYIVMELLEGEDLRTRLLRERKLSLATTVNLVTQVARGLSRAHAAEIVHRDIKPGNIFLMEQEGDLFIKILDFGIAKRIGDVESAVTMTGQIIGTPHYVSPEQIQRPREADPQSDLWSLAVVAYRCLTGELPFEGESVGAVAIAIDKAAFRPVTEREPALPKMLDEWFGRAFARARSARFGSAKELAVAFEAASRDQPLPVVDPDSASFSLRSATPPPVAPSPRAAPNDIAGPDATPGGVEGKDAALAEERTTRNDRHELADAPAGLSAPALALAAAPLAVARPQAIAPEQAPAETPRKGETPFALGEPTLSQGTVTQIELGHPKRTRLYGIAIAAIAVGGAITVGVLSRGDDPAPNAAASTPAAAAPEVPAAVAATATAATATAPATATATGSAQPVSSGDAPATDPAPTAKATAAPVRAAAPAAAGTQTRTKKDRGF